MKLEVSFVPDPPRQVPAAVMAGTVAQDDAVFAVAGRHPVQGEEGADHGIQDVGARAAEGFPLVVRTVGFVT